MSCHPPIARCPQEILENIFLDCLPDSPQPDRALTPLRLAHVCSWWRSVAFHLPSLWRSLYLSVNSKKLSRFDFLSLDSLTRPRVSENTRLLAKIYAENARHHTLDLHFEIHSLCRGLGPILTSYADRLRSLRLQVIPAYTSIDILDPFLNLPDSSVPLLDSLHLTWTYSSAIRFNNVTTFACAPNLRKLRLGFTPTDAADALLEPSFDSYYFMIPWVQLTHICMDNISLETWYDLLHACPKLEQSLVTFSSFSHTVSSSLFMLAHPHPGRTISHLKTLGINLGRSAGLFSFEHLNMPALETLQLSAKPWTRNERARKFAWDCPRLSAFRWLKNLTTLVVSLQDMSTHVEGLVSVLTYAGGLKNLEVYYIENGSDVEMMLLALTVPEGGQQVTLPKLESVKLQMANTYDLRPATRTFSVVLREFLSGRWWLTREPMDNNKPAPSARLVCCEIGMAFFRGRGAKTFFADVERVTHPFRAQGLCLNVYESRCSWTCDQLTKDWW